MTQTREECSCAEEPMDSYAQKRRAAAGLKCADDACSAPVARKMVSGPEARLGRELSQRLKEVYSLERSPSTIAEFAGLWNSAIVSRPEYVEYLKQVKLGKKMIGETTKERGYAVVGGGSDGNVKCGLDALATTWLRGEGTIRAKCPHCGEPMEIIVQRGKIVKQTPHGGIVFYIGAGPSGSSGEPICDHLHVFPSDAHAEAWFVAQHGEQGVKVSLEDGFRLGRIFDVSK